MTFSVEKLTIHPIGLEVGTPSHHTSTAAPLKQIEMSDEGEEHSGDVVRASAPAKELPEAATSSTLDGGDPPSSSLAKGLSYTISTIIRDLDSQAQQTSRSQDQLSSAIDRLTRELDQLLADAPSPFIVQHAAKISGVRKRVSSLNVVLKSIQRRVDNIDRLVSAGLPTDEIATPSPAAQ